MSDIEHQDYYNKGDIECYDVIDVMVIGYNSQDSFDVGQVTKYLYRAPYKGHRQQDIGKALKYLQRLNDRQKPKPKPLSATARTALNNVLSSKLKHIAETKGISLEAALNRAVAQYVNGD